MRLVDKMAARLPGVAVDRPGFEGFGDHGVSGEHHHAAGAQAEDHRFDLFGKAGAWTARCWWEHHSWRIVASALAIDYP